MQSTLSPLRNTLPAPTVSTTSLRIERTLVDFAVLFAGVLIVALAILGVGWQHWHQSRIYTGVSVAGVPVGGLTRARLVEELGQARLPTVLPPLNLTLAERRWPILAEQTWASVDWLATANQAFLVGRQGTWVMRLSEQMMTAALGQREITPELIVDIDQLRAIVGRIAAEAHRPGRAASQIGEITIPAQPGIAVDVEATVQHVLAALENGFPGQSLEVPVVATLVTASTAATERTLASSTQAESTSALAPFRLHNAQFQLTYAIDPVVWRTILAPGLAPEAPQRLDEDRLRTVLGEWAQQIDRPARDARLGFDVQTQRVSTLQPSLPGRVLNIDATVAAIQDAVAAGQAVGELVVEVVAPAVDSNRVAEMGIRELVASATTYFQGSSGERVHNIDVASLKFEGLVIPPGGIFSFNDAVGEVNSANGFEDSLIIWGDQTVVGVGGGVCQVSTTVFRAAYTAGFSIVERYNHGYIVDWYGEPGLDATIYTPTVDFRFRNDSGAHLLIEAVVDRGRGTMTFNFYGTKMDRQVTLSEPVHTDIRQPGPPEYRVDESLAPGEIRQVEWEKPGMTVIVTRTILENGASRTDTITSQYQPWRAVYLVGPGTEVP
jgi:vancomycin resistance protein YoaR